MRLISIDNVASVGAASIAAGATGTFDLSSIHEGGNVVIISNDGGGMCRMTITAEAPQATTATAASKNFMFDLDNGNIMFTSDFAIQEVRILAITNAWGVTGVTVIKDLS